MDQIPNHFVLNMDETPIYWDMPMATTIASTGSSTVHLRRTHSETARISVLLTIAADGTKLPPYLIFKGKADGRIATREFREPGRYPSGVVLACQPNAFNDEQNMMKWLHAVCSFALY